MTTQSPIQTRASLDLEIHSANPVNDLQFRGTAPAGFPERMEVSGEDNGEVGDEKDNRLVRISEADGMSRAIVFLGIKEQADLNSLQHWDRKQAGKGMRLLPNSSCIPVFHFRRVTALS